MAHSNRRHPSSDWRWRVKLFAKHSDIVALHHLNLVHSSALFRSQRDAQSIHSWGVIIRCEHIIDAREPNNSHSVAPHRHYISDTSMSTNMPSVRETG